MSKLYIFAIGGTGARVLRSLTMMMAAGVNINAQEIVPVIIDPDNSNADLTRTVMHMNAYQELHGMLTFTSGNPCSFFKTAISKKLPNYTLRVQDTEDKTFKQFISLSSMSKENQAMARMLFSEKNLQSNMNVGFKGNPNIGSVVLNQIVNSPDFEEFANSFSQDDKIFIISSIFGGTGASGFPLLLKTLRTGDNFPNHHVINGAEIGAITVLPYFDLKVDEESEIDSSTFISKTKSALAYYEDNISKNNQINALYYLADKIRNIYANHEGGTAQQNDAHLVEFLASTAIIDFCNNSHPNTVNKELGLNGNSDVITFESFYDSLTIMLRKQMTQFTMMVNSFKDQKSFIKSNSFAANSRGIGVDVYSGEFGRKLSSFFNLYVTWLEEMKNNKRSLNLFSTTNGNKPFELITGVKAKKIMSRYSDYDLFFDRLNGSVSKCISNDSPSKLMEVFYRGTETLVKEKFNF